MVFWLGLGVSMSVVNDILKDLHQRRRQHQYMPNIPLDFEGGDLPKFNVFKRLSLLIIILITLSSLIYFMLFNYQSNQILSTVNQQANVSSRTQEKSLLSERNDQKEYLASLDHTIPVEPIFINELDNKTTLPDANIGKQPTISELDNAESSKSSPTNSNAQSVIKPKLKIQSPVKNISVKDNPNTGNKKAVVKAVSNDELLIRKLMVSNPEKVWPHIKKLLPKSNNQTSLIALGAQGEQRSKNHQNAIELYKTLSEIEPNESKWRVGTAISYDALSRYEDALIEYKKSLVLNALPAPLYSFVKQRIAQLTGIDNER
jgi:hypothetical protein